MSNMVAYEVAYTLLTVSMTYDTVPTKIIQRRLIIVYALSAKVPSMANLYAVINA